MPVPAHPTRIGLLSDVDDGGEIWDWKRKSLVVEVPHWTGQCTSDGRLGLHVSVRGALQLIDMRSGHVVYSQIATKKQIFIWLNTENLEPSCQKLLRSTMLATQTHTIS